MTQDDVQALLASQLQPLEDPAFMVPPCGRGEQEDVLRERRRQGAAHALLQQQDPDAVDSKPYADPSSPTGGLEVRWCGAVEGQVWVGLGG